MEVTNGQKHNSPDWVVVQVFRNFGIDSDEDGLGDMLEVSLGLNSYATDSFGDGLRDGNRDLDKDGVMILQELTRSAVVNL